MLLSTCSLLVLLAGVANAGLPLPSYIKPCARLSPDFEACALKSAQETIPHIVKGHRKYKIPPIDPLEVTEIAVDNKGPKQAGIDIRLYNCKFYGPGDTIMKDVKVDFDKKTLTLDLIFPRIEVIGQYEISGRVLLLPITGKGPLNVTMVDADTHFFTDYVIKKRDGEEFMILENARIARMNPKRAYFDLQNLFNGDKFLGPEMNNVLNDNWKEAFEELSPPVIQAISQIIATIVNNISGSVPFKEAFPETV